MMLINYLFTFFIIKSYSYLISGHKYINHMYHLNHTTEDLHRYAIARNITQSFTFYLKYNKRYLNIQLYPPHHADSLSTQMLASFNNHSLFTGFVQGDAGSEVYGHFTKQGLFSGVVYTKSEIIHVEPGHRFNETSHNVVYRRSDVDYKKVYRHIQSAHSANTDMLYFNKTQVPYSFQPPVKSSDVPFRYKRSTAGRFPRHKKTCPVFLVSDHLFYKHMGLEDEETTQNELILHLHEADKIFRSTDFDNNGVNDNIGFSVANISILKENTAQNKFSDDIIAVKEFLDRWSEYNHDQYCLAVLFTYRDFDSGVLGLAWVASVDGAPGGICQKRQAVGGYNRNLNTAIVSLINFGRYVGHAVSFITVAHELGHNFGSSHDEETYSCSPGIRGGGNYIMYARATDGNLPNNIKFSACSKEAITRVLSVKSNSCFQVETSYCGNKIKEWDEICDCGNEDTCDEVDKCCEPKTSANLGCTLRRPYRARYQYQCSPQQGPCCDERTCMFKAKSVKCNAEETCKHSSYCNGETGECPSAPHKSNKTLCMEGANTCLKGECRGSVCQLVNLEECQCEKDNLCTVCCLESNGICRPTGSLLHAKTELTYLMSGKSCNNYQGYCNADHECVQVNLNNPLTTLEDVFSKKNFDNALQWLKKHWYYTLTIIGCMVLLCILLKVTYRRSAPMQKYLQQVSQTLRRVGSKPANSQYQHQQLISTDDDHDKMVRMCSMFPTASRSVTWDVRREAVSEEAAVVAMLNLGYPFKPNCL